MFFFARRTRKTRRPLKIELYFRLSICFHFDVEKRARGSSNEALPCDVRSTQEILTTFLFRKQHHHHPHHQQQQQPHTNTRFGLAEMRDGAGTDVAPGLLLLRPVRLPIRRGRLPREGRQGGGGSQDHAGASGNTQYRCLKMSHVPTLRRWRRMARWRDKRRWS